MTELNLIGLVGHVWPALSRKPDCPGSTALNLDATRTYWLLRDPSELRKAMKTFKQIPSRIDHRPCRGSIIPIALVITSTASNAELNSTDLTNSLVICAEPAIRAVESGERWDISCGRKYAPLMRFGIWKSRFYDGVWVKSLLDMPLGTRTPG